MTPNEAIANLVNAGLAKPVSSDEAIVTPAPIRGADIQATGAHDAGAIARCSYCGRYSDDPKALQYDSYSFSKHDLKCECGKTHGWCGSFKTPTADSIWSA